MPRVRVLFSKRGPFCFIRHVELPQVFSRSARRAGMAIDKTRGFSPHPKISLGPALPVGVVALAEPAEIWFSRWEDGYKERLNACLPWGLSLSKAQIVGGPSLNDLCRAGEYLIRPLSSRAHEEFARLFRDGRILKDRILDWRSADDGIVAAVADPLETGPGKIVGDLVREGAVKDWADLRMARICVGLWDENSRSVTPLVRDPLEKRLGEGR